MKSPIAKLGLMLVLILVSFVAVNLVLNYAFMFMATPKLLKTGDIPPDYYEFQAKYLYTIVSDKFQPKMAILMALMAGILLFYKINARLNKRDNTKVYGSSRWATTAEIKKTFYAIPEKNIESAEKSGICIVRQGGKLYVDTQTINSLVIGTTRSGKGQTFVLPMIRIMSQGKMRQSFVLNDPKGELVENCYDMLKNKDYKIVILNLRETNLSSLWNPLAPIIKEYVKSQKTDDGDVSKVSELIGELSRVFTDNPKSDPIWPNSAKSLLSAMILYLVSKGYENECLDKVNMYSVYNFFLEYGGRNEVREQNGGKVMVNALDELFQTLPVGSPAKLAYATSNFATGDMRSSIFSTLANNLEIFSDTGIAKLTSGDEIDFEDLTHPEKPCAIFMVVPDEKVNRHVLASLFVNQCYSQLIDIASNYPEQKLPQRIQFILDEFGNMVRIPSMDVKLTVCLGRNILFNLFIQDLQQLDTKYDTAAKTIRSNCGNLIYINSIDDDTNEYMSRVLGEGTIEYETYSGKLDEYLSNQNVNITGKRLLKADELSILEFGEAVTKRQRCRPFRTKFQPFYELKLPKVEIKKIIGERQRNLSDWLFPFDVLEMEIQKDTPNEDTQRADILNKIDEFYNNEYIPSLQNHDFKTCNKYINDAKFKQVISQSEAETLQNIIAVMQDD